MVPTHGINELQAALERFIHQYPGGIRAASATVLRTLWVLAQTHEGGTTDLTERLHGLWEAYRRSIAPAARRMT